jgi:serine protease Do
MIRSRRLVTLLPLLLLLTGCPGDDRPADPAVRADRPAPAEGFRDVVEAALPAIVFIQTEATPPPGLEQLFPHIPELPDEPMPFGMGSGVLFTEDGYILTNNHVVHQAERVTVVLHDRRYFEAEVVGRDPSTEVAVVKIDATGLPTATLGDSDAIGPGDWVLAMGSPLGLQFSVTAGIVSGVGRDIGILGGQMDPEAGQAAPLEHFIQTDAPLSPGNSGGPLMNTAGEVVGINTAIAAGHGGAPGGVLGFAIPSNLARRVAEQLIEHGEVRRPYIGVALVTVTPALARQQGLRTVEGAAIAHVESGSPGDRAGLREGDVVLGIGDRDVQTMNDLQAALVQMDPGDTARLRIFREGRETTVDVELAMVRGATGAAAPASP